MGGGFKSTEVWNPRGAMAHACEDEARSWTIRFPTCPESNRGGSSTSATSARSIEDLVRSRRSSLLIESLRLSCWLVICLASLVLASISGTSASERSHHSPEIERAQILLDRSDCAGAWNTSWPLAKDGNQEARLFLFTSLPRMFPPPVTQEGDRWHYQHLLVLAAYAALTPPDQLPPVMRSGRAFRHEVFAAIANLRLARWSASRTMLHRGPISQDMPQSRTIHRSYS